MVVGFLTWLAIGLLVGFIASKLVNLRGDDPLVGILCAAGGAIAAGVLFSLLSGRGLRAWDAWAVGAAILGAAAATGIYHAVRSRTISHNRQSIRRSY